MEAEIQGYLTEFGIIRGDIHSAIQGLNNEGASWHPLQEGTNSIYAIMELLTRWEKAWTEIEVILGKLTYAQLSEVRSPPFRAERKESVTIQWIILHLITHHATHLGHIQLTRQLWEQQHR